MIHVLMVLISQDAVYFRNVNYINPEERKKHVWNKTKKDLLVSISSVSLLRLSGIHCLPVYRISPLWVQNSAQDFQVAHLPKISFVYEWAPCFVVEFWGGLGFVCVCGVCVCMRTHTFGEKKTVIWSFHCLQLGCSAPQLQVSWTAL